jgi:hypothetical protein
MSAISVEPPFAKQDNIGWTYTPTVPTGAATASGVTTVVLTQAVPAGVWAVSASIRCDATAGQLITRTTALLQRDGVNFIFSNSDGNTNSSNAFVSSVITCREPSTLSVDVFADTDAGTYQVIGGGASSLVSFTRIA